MQIPRSSLFATQTPSVLTPNTRSCENARFWETMAFVAWFHSGIVNHRGSAWCFFSQLLLRGEYSSAGLLEIQCTVTSDSLHQECSLLRTCLTTQQSPEIQVKSWFLGLLGRVSNTSLTKHQQSYRNEIGQFESYKGPTGNGVRAHG